MIYKTLHRNLKIEEHEPHKKVRVELLYKSTEPPSPLPKAVLR